MNDYAVYRHPQHGYEAVKQGFSWPALFFTGIWAFVKSLWTQGIAFFAAVVMLTLLEDAFARAQNEVGMLLVFTGQVALFLIFGFKGNGWRESALRRRGWERMGVLQARSPEAAVAQAQE